MSVDTKQQLVFSKSSNTFEIFQSLKVNVDGSQTTFRICDQIIIVGYKKYFPRFINLSDVIFRNHCHWNIGPVEFGFTKFLHWVHNNKKNVWGVKRLYDGPKVSVNQMKQYYI